MIKTLIDTKIEEFRAMFDSNIWRDEKDPTVSLMAIGNVEEWLRQALIQVVATQREADKAVLEGMKRIKPSVLTSQGFTKPTCKDCGAKFSWHNGNPPVLCKDCKLPIEINAFNAALDQAIEKLV